MESAPADIPNRSVFRAPEVCDLAQVQPYVLRTWEAEFPDLGVSRTPGGPRVYRRADVERVLQIKQLLFVEGLTLAGVRRRLVEGRAAAPAEAGSLAELVGPDVRDRLLHVKRGLQELLNLLAPEGNGRGPSLSAPAGSLFERMEDEGIPRRDTPAPLVSTPALKKPAAGEARARKAAPAGRGRPARASGRR
jgi:DNA-binding transcriptional MerR regulator